MATLESALRATRAQAGRLVIPGLEVRATPGVRGRLATQELAIPARLVTQGRGFRAIPGLETRVRLGIPGLATPARLVIPG